MQPEQIVSLYRELQQYVGWEPEDNQRILELGPVVAPSLQPLIDDFYLEIERHPAARNVIVGGNAQVERLKQTLLHWIRELFSGNYGDDYVHRRWRVGRRHVEIGLDQVFANAALSRLRKGLLRAARESWPRDPNSLAAAKRSLNMLLDLDCALIQAAYQDEFSNRLQRVERLAAIGQVAGGVAHELRNPLNVIKTSVYYLRNARNVSPDKYNEHLGRVERQVEIADRVITALSNFAKLPTPELNAFSLGECVEQAISSNPVPPRVKCDVALELNNYGVLADFNQMLIVLGNLIRNACEAMPDGGTLRFTAVRIPDFVELSVSDTGTGIPAEELSRIMEPFYSTKTRGIGLGLALASSIVGRNGGKLRVTSEVGKGTTFVVKLLADRSTDGHAGAAS
ncbi:MAG TPA: protoglobin domain-containing protein [Planctomycetaceae bacterium]|nr:protoglobin domain-containing protein [Planctomycetaceae bacterium]